MFLVDFSDYAMTYEIKFYMGNHSRINETNDSVRTNVWYELKRQGITIPFPIRTLHVERKKGAPVQEDQAEAFSILRGEPLFDVFPKNNSITWSTRLVSNFSAGRTSNRGRRCGRVDVRDAPRCRERFRVKKWIENSSRNTAGRGLFR